MKIRRIFSLLFGIFCFGGILNAQLNVNSSVTATQLVQSLIGNGIAVSNVVLNCGAGAYGSFSNGNTTNLGINNGIVLTTGSADTVGSPNTSGFDVSICIGTTFTDPDLVAIDPTATNDVCILEFDIIPKCDSLSVRFVFGSEEYPNFVNSINDLFGFFVTGPNPFGPPYVSQNIAVIPGNIPVTINNINNGNTNTGPCMNCAYYIDNTGGPTIQYDGMTVVITAGLAMIPCQSYHFKIAIADASDCALDSGVFLDYLACITGFTAVPSSTPDMCNSCTGTATVTVNGGQGPYTYQWLPSGGNAATATNLCAGTYSVLVMDQSSCGIPDTIIVNVANIGSIALNVQQNDASCFGDCNGSLVVTPQGGSAPFTYVWNPNVSTTDTANGLCAGSYTVDVTDAGGCTNQYTYTITQPTQLSLAITGTDSICAGTNTTMTAAPAGGTGPYTISWDNSLPNGISQTVSPNVTTIYTATVTDANGCNLQQTFTVTINPAPVAAFVPGPNDCSPATIQFTNTSQSGTTWYWDFGDPSTLADTSGAQNPSYTYNASGTYDVTLIASFGSGCYDTIVIPGAVTVFANPVAGVSVVNANVSELSPDVTFNDLSTGGNYCVFYFGDGDSLIGCNMGSFIHTYDAAGTYTAMQVIVNADGCVDTTYITVVVEEETTIYVPNAFTPNNNGANETFLAYGTKVETFHLMVFDRWGNLLFESSDITKGWDGTYKGTIVQEDVYVWKINYTDQQGKKFRMIGHVSLIR